MNTAMIPGTTTAYPVYERKGPPPLKNDAQANQRRGLLAKIHIAKQQMGLNDGEYDMILKSFKVATAADLTLPQLENMVKLLKHYGWKPRKSRAAADADDRLAALRYRCVETAREIPNGEKRLAGLALKICGTSQLSWCRDASKLERLLAVLGKIKEEAHEPPAW